MERSYYSETEKERAMGRAVLGRALFGNTRGKARDVYGVHLKRKGKNKGGGGRLIFSTVP